MSMRSIFFAALAAMVGNVVFTSAYSQTTPLISDVAKKARVELVSEFVRELEVLYRLQETAKKELAEDNSPSGKLATGIRLGTRTLLAMHDSINRLSRIPVTGRWAEFRDLLKQAHNDRITIVQEMNGMSKAMLEGPQPGVNYGAMAARAPELTAHVEEIDKTMFTMAQAMFFGLVDDGRVSSDGNLHHLLLTKRERAAMIQLIDKIFGRSLDDKNATSIVSAAYILKYGLTRPIYKSVDEP
jgi:hypothetical protein